MKSVHNLPELLILAQDTAVEAVGNIKKDIEKYQEVSQDFERDVKVLADAKLESIILERLSENSQFAILSEEAGYLATDEQKEDYFWIVDPLDGSVNFSRGIPFNCVSIALWKGMDPLLGVIYDFHHKEMFSGLVGDGAWLNNSPIMTSEVAEKKHAILCTGFPVRTDFSNKSLNDFVLKIKEYKKVRLFGSASLSLAYVACGRVDAYSENDIMLWDVAAGIALVKAAGGIVQYSSTQDANILRVFAGNQYLSQLVSTIEESRAVHAS